MQLLSISAILLNLFNFNEKIEDIDQGNNLDKELKEISKLEEERDFKKKQIEYITSDAGKDKWAKESQAMKNPGEKVFVIHSEELEMWEIDSKDEIPYFMKNQFDFEVTNEENLYGFEWRFEINNNFEIWFANDHLTKQFTKLEYFLENYNIDFKKIEYIDLRIDDKVFWK